MLIIYINDVVKFVNCAKTGLYADDTVCYRNGTNIDSVNIIMTRAAARFALWCELNKLAVNLGKSKVILFSNKKGKCLKSLKQSINIKIADTHLEVMSDYKYLGIQLDQHLDYNSSIKYLKSTISQRHYLLKKIRWSGFKEAILIFESSILPYFDLGNIFHSGANLDVR